MGHGGSDVAMDRRWLPFPNLCMPSASRAISWLRSRRHSWRCAVTAADRGRRYRGGVRERPAARRMEVEQMEW